MIARLLKCSAALLAAVVLMPAAAGAQEPADDEQFAPLASANEDVASLAELLNSPSSAVRLAGVLGLQYYGHYALPALDSLIRLFADEPRNARAAATAAASIGPDAMVGLRAALSQGSDVEREYACYALGELFHERRWFDRTPALPELIAALGDPVWQVQRAAAGAISELRQDGGPAVPALIRMLNGDSPEVQETAGATLASIGEPALEPLLRMLGSEDESQRVLAAQVLGQMPYPAERRVEPLLDALRWGGMTALAAVEALDSLHYFSTDAELVKVYRDAPEARLYIIRLIGQGHGYGEQATQLVIEALQGPDRLLQKEALMSLVYLDARAPEATAAIAGLLGDPDVWSCAVLALADIGTAALPALKEQAKSSDPLARSSAALALGMIAPGDWVTAELLAAAVIDPQVPADNRLRAMQMLGDLGPSASAAVPVLCQGLKADEQLARTWSAQTLGLLGPLAAKAVPALSAALNTDDFFVTQQVIIALGEIGPAAAAALPELQQRVNDDVYGALARAAIAAIAGEA